MDNYNVKQITNDICESATELLTETYSVKIGGKNIEVTYYILDKNFLSFNDAGIFKMGYICEPKAIGIPILLKFKGTDDRRKIFYIGKTGMLEIIPGTFCNINDQETEEKELYPEIIEILVPKEREDDTQLIKFKLDYLVSV